MLVGIVSLPPPGDGPPNLAEVEGESRLGGLSRRHCFRFMLST